MIHTDIVTLRDLAARYLERCHVLSPARRDLWRAHNSRRPTRPPLYVRAVPWDEVAEVWKLTCTDPFYRHYEWWFRAMLYRSEIPDDYIYEPWVTVGAATIVPSEGVWGVAVKRVRSDDPGGACHFEPVLATLADRDKLIFPHHRIDETATTERVAKLHDAIGDLLPIAVDRAPAYRTWVADIITQLAQLRGLERILWDMVDEPEWLHGILAFMRDGILATHREAESVGDWRRCAHENQAMPYAEELPDPSPDPSPVSRAQLWTFFAAQELTLVSPAMHDEFLLQYQLPIIREFGLASYGCCEDLTEKIGMLRQIPNLRRIAVAPVANVARCAEQIGRDYVFSYRPSPAEMVCCGFDPDHVRRTLTTALGHARTHGCYIDITLKDVETCQGHPDRLHAWARIAREVADAYL